MINLLKKIFNKKPYISEADQFIYNFDKHNLKKSASQIAEITKHQRIAKLRDNVIITKNSNNKPPLL
jgi:hypothetical protein